MKSASNSKAVFAATLKYGLLPWKKLLNDEPVKSTLLLEFEELKTKLTTLSPKIADKAVQIKLDEVIKLLTPLSKSHKVNDDNLINLLQYYELLNEIKNIHGKV